MIQKPTFLRSSSHPLPLFGEVSRPLSIRPSEPPRKDKKAHGPHPVLHPDVLTDQERRWNWRRRGRGSRNKRREKWCGGVERRAFEGGGCDGWDAGEGRARKLD